MRTLLRRILDTIRAGTVRELLKSGTGVAGVRIGSMALSFALSVLLARVLGPQGYGIYAFAFAILTIGGMPVLKGVPTLVVREVAKIHVRREWGLLRGLKIRADQSAIIPIILGAAGLGIVAVVIPYHLEQGQIPTLGWTLVLLPLMVWTDVRGAVLRGLRRVVRGYIPGLLVRRVVFLIVVLLLHLAIEVTPAVAMLSHVVGGAAALGCAIVLVGRTLPSRVKNAQPEYETKKWLAAVLPLSLFSGLMMVNSQVDITVLGVIRDSDEVGIYRVAVQGSNLAVFGQMAANMLLAPYVANLYEKGDKDRLTTLYKAGTVVGVSVAVVVTAAMTLYGAELLELIFGASFRPGATALVVLCVGQIGSAIAGPALLLLNMTGHEQRTVKWIALALVGNAIMSVGLVPFYGMMGAAIVTAASVVFWNVALRREAGRVFAEM